MSITRQTFILENAGGTIAYTPTIAYDPVARIVTITPLATPGQALVAGQSYDVVITTPGTAATPNDGLRAIDGATLKGGPVKLVFSVTAAAPAPPPTVSIDFCRDINPIFTQTCGTLPMCHGRNRTRVRAPALSPFRRRRKLPWDAWPWARTRDRSRSPSPPTLLFAEDMPIIDANGRSTGDPGNSWLMYKVLLAIPSPEPVDAGSEEEAGAEEAGAPDATVEAGEIDAGTADAGARGRGRYGRGRDGRILGRRDCGRGRGGRRRRRDARGAARGRLRRARAHCAARDLGCREGDPHALHPRAGDALPAPVGTPPSTLTAPLTLSNLERLSLWISQGAVSQASCPNP